jgi:hypothetical protein
MLAPVPSSRAFLLCLSGEKLKPSTVGQPQALLMRKCSALCSGQKLLQNFDNSNTSKVLSTTVLIKIY